MLMLRCFIILAILLLLWQLIIYLGDLPDYILPSPMKVAHAMFDYREIILRHAETTLVETLLGFICGIIFGCITAMLIAFSPVISLWFLPLLIISQAIPTFAISPLIVMWLGYGLASKIAITILMIFFPVTSAFYDGLKSTQSGWLDLAKTMNAKKWRTFFFIRIPAALPALTSGIRIAAVIAPIGAIIGEWVGSSRGLGYLMLNANARMQIDMMFAALIVIILLSLMLYFTVDKLLRMFVTWQS